MSTTTTVTTTAVSATAFKAQLDLFTAAVKAGNDGYSQSLSVNVAPSGALSFALTDLTTPADPVVSSYTPADPPTTFDIMVVRELTVKEMTDYLYQGFRSLSQ